MKNGFENLPIFVGAILAGNLAQLSSRTMNAFVGTYLAMRVLYTVVYVGVSSNRNSYWRTGIYFLSTGVCMGVYVGSGVVLNKGV